MGNKFKAHLITTLSIIIAPVTSIILLINFPRQVGWTVVIFLILFLIVSFYIYVYEDIKKELEE